MQRNLVTSIILYEAVRTTKKRAEVIRPTVDHLIAVAKSKAPHIAIRYINAVVNHKNASRKMMEVLKLRYADRTSGFTRIVPLGSRQGDGAKLVRIELLEGKDVVPAPKAEKTAKTKPATKKATSSKKDTSSAS